MSLPTNYLRASGKHLLWVGPRTVTYLGESHTPQQVYLGVLDRPVFSSCEYPSCLTHLHASVIVARLEEEDVR